MSGVVYCNVSSSKLFPLLILITFATIPIRRDIILFASFSDEIWGHNITTRHNFTTEEATTRALRHV